MALPPTICGVSREVMCAECSPGITSTLAGPVSRQNG